MAKAQKRSNREAKKPKQAKAAPKPEGTFANQIKPADKASGPGKRKN
jgi:hypothetical protein